MTYGYSKDGGRGARLRRATGGTSPADAALLGAAIAATVEDAPPRPGGVIDQFTNRVVEMMGQAGRCPCSYPDIDPETVSDDAPDGVCACGHAADEHADDGQCQAVDA